MKKSMIFVGLLAIGYANAQEYDGKVGINTNEPKATLDITPEANNLTGTTNEGIIAPRLSKTRIANIEASKLTEGTLVYATDAVYTAGADAAKNGRVAKINEKGYYFYNGTEWVKVQYKDSDTNDAEWVYDDTTKRINLKRSGQTTGFVNKVYYDAQTGQFVNQEAERSYIDGTDTIKENIDGRYQFTQKLSSTIAPRVTHNNTRNYKSLGYNNFDINEPVELASLRLDGISSNLNLLDSNKSSSFWVTGLSGTVTKNDNTNTNYLIGTGSSVSVLNGTVDGYATAGRFETYINSPKEQTSQINAITSMLSTGSNSTTVKEMVGVHSFLAFGNSTVAEAVKEKAVLFKGYFDYRNLDPKIPALAGFYYQSIQGALSELNRTEAHYGIYLEDVAKAKSNYAIYSNAGQVRFGDLADTSATADRTVVVDKDGVLKTGGSITSNNGVQTQSGMTCTAENAGKINYTTIQKDGKDVGVFGFCMQKGTDYVWAYMLGGSNIYGTSANGAAFGQGL